MSTLKKIIRNSFIITLAQVGEIIVSVIFVVYLGRYFGTSGFGKLSFLSLFIFLIGAMDNQWIRPIIIRELSNNRKESGRLFGNAIIIKTIAALLMIVVFSFIMMVSEPPKDIKNLLFFVGVNLLFSSLVSSYGIIAEVELKVGYLKLVNFCVQIMNLFILFLVMYFRQDLHFFYILSLIPILFGFILIKHYTQKIVRPSFVFDRIIWRKIIINSWPLALTSLFIFFYHRMDQVILMHSKGSEAVGIYSIGVRFAEFFSIIPLALMWAAFPVMSRYASLAPDNFKTIYRLSFKYLLMLIVPVSVVICFYSRYFIGLFYSGNFLLSADVLNILIVAEIFVYMGVVNNVILISTAKQIIDPLLTGASFIVNLVLNLILIPRYGVIGAAVASLCAYATGPLIGLFFSYTKEYSKYMFYYLIKPILASFVMGCLLFYLNLPAFISIFLSFTVYLAVLFLIKGITKTDLKMLEILSEEVYE